MQVLIIICISNHFYDPDDESDTEVPYADIMITVRGSSTPELTQVSYLTAGDQQEVRDKFNMFPILFSALYIIIYIGTKGGAIHMQGYLPGDAYGQLEATEIIEHRPNMDSA